jgi:hypothetical protein
MKEWSSESVQLAPSFVVDVRANHDGVTLGTYIAEVHATDLVLAPKQARAIAALLIQGADKSEEIQGAGE